MKFGEQAEFLEELAEQGRIPAALEARARLLPHQRILHEAFWILASNLSKSGGGFSPVLLEHVRITDAVALAEVYGFDPVYFLRVLNPAFALYREQVEERINR